MENQNTIASTLHQKAVLYIEKRTIKKIIKQGGQLIAGLAIGILLIKPSIILEVSSSIFVAYNFAFIKIIFGLWIATNISSLIRWPLRMRAKIIKKRNIDHGLFHGIPIEELAEYLIRNQNIKREGVNGIRKTFGLNMEKYNTMAQELERRRIVRRGEKNMRILDGKWSRQALVAYLQQEDDGGNDWIRINRISPEAKKRLQKSEI